MNKQRQSLQRCFDNICKNFDMLANLKISELLCDRNQYDVLVSFIDVHSSSSFSFYEIELLKHFTENGIKSKKDYRQFRDLIRIKLIQAVRQIHDLTHENLRILGGEYEKSTDSGLTLEQSQNQSNQ